MVVVATAATAAVGATSTATHLQRRAACVAHREEQLRNALLHEVPYEHAGLQHVFSQATEEHGVELEVVVALGRPPVARGVWCVDAAAPQEAADVVVAGIQRAPVPLRIKRTHDRIASREASMHIRPFHTVSSRHSSVPKTRQCMLDAQPHMRALGSSAAAS